MGQLDDDRIQLVVSAEGEGFDPKQLTVKGDDGGGFGLFGIRERLDDVGGHLEINSAPGRGARMVLSAPVRRQPKALERAGAVRTPVVGGVRAAPLPGAAATGKIRVLVADDHAVVRDELTRLLNMEADMEVVAEAADGQQAIDQANLHRPDVVLMDLSMPVMNGIEATRRIREALPGIEVIGLSMYDKADQAEAMINAGAGAYLSKAGPPSELIAAIRAAVRHSHGGSDHA